MSQRSGSDGMITIRYITGTGGEKQPNVVPSEVRVQVDSRLLPGVRLEEHRDVEVASERHSKFVFEVQCSGQPPAR